VKILITGATGFIGRELGKELVRRGHTISVMSRNIHWARVTLPFPAEIISGRDGLPPKALDGIDAVVNLAGEPLASRRWTKKHKALIRDSRIKITSDLMRLVRNSNVRAVVSASAIGIYGDRGDETLNEDSGPGSGFLPEVCRSWEAELFSGADGMADPPRLVAVRVGFVLGRSGGAVEKLLPLFRRGLGGVLGSGTQYMSWIHIYDLVQLIVFALENENVNGALNGTSPSPVINSEFTKVFAKVVGRDAMVPVPGFGLKLAVGEMAEIILSGQKVLPERPRQLGFKFKYTNLEEALKDIHGGLKPGEEDFVQEQFLPLRAEEILKMLETDQKLQNFGSLKSDLKTFEHSRRLLPLGEGIILHDKVVYRVRGGWPGQVAMGGKYADKIKKIFTERQQALDVIWRSA
jgi:uncharacterized protein